MVKVPLLLYCVYLMAGAVILEESKSESRRGCAEKIINNIFYDSKALNVLTDDSKLCVGVWDSIIPKTALNINDQYNMYNTDHLIMCLSNVTSFAAQSRKLIKLRLNAFRKGYTST
uniref:Uncharacterized protein n=1 Tax=Photinus pyralis TaxID=7054 RepID=A0A1Y1L8X9_PHOPY